MDNKSTAYKDSPIGRIPNDWKLIKLSEIVPEDKQITYGIVKAGEYKDVGIYMVRSQDYSTGWCSPNQIMKVTKEIEQPYIRSRINKDDILITLVGAGIGNTAMVPDWLDGANISRASGRISIDDNKANKYYVYQYLGSGVLNKIIGETLIGGAQPVLNLNALNNIDICSPPLSEQKAIAHILGLMDIVINNNNSLIAQKELRKKWLMQHLLTGKKRLKGYSGEWKEIHIRDVAKEVSIRNKSDKQLTVLSCTKYDGLVPSLEYFGRKIFADDVSTYKIVPKNHFAYATNHIEEGSIGYQEIIDEALISPMYTVFKTDKTVNDNFFYKLLKSHPLVYQYQNRMEGSIDRRGGLRWDGFSIIKIKLPSYEEQTAIAQVLQAADKEISLLKAKAEKLREQKKGLMQVLLTGKKRLKITNEKQ